MAGIGANIEICVAFLDWASARVPTGPLEGVFALHQRPGLDTRRNSEWDLRDDGDGRRSRLLVYVSDDPRDR